MAEVASVGLSSDAYHLVIPNPDPTQAIAALQCIGKIERKRLAGEIRGQFEFRRFVADFQFGDGRARKSENAEGDANSEFVQMLHIDNSNGWTVRNLQVIRLTAA